MNIISKNMNKMNTNIVITIVTSIYKDYTEPPLDTIGNPSKACLPPSRPSLTIYALEYGGALRMIRVFVFSNDLCHMPRGVAGVGIYSPKSPT